MLHQKYYFKNIASKLSCQKTSRKKCHITNVAAKMAHQKQRYVAPKKLHQKHHTKVSHHDCLTKNVTSKQCIETVMPKTSHKK